MRLIYIDEAGTSAREPVAVVVAVVVEGDFEWKVAGDYLAYLRRKYVPEEHWKGHIFHAKDIHAGSDKGYLAGMSFEKRMRLLNRLVSAPRRLGLSMVYGYFHRRSDIDEIAGIRAAAAKAAGRNPEAARSEVLKNEASTRHVNAFSLCLKEANDLVERYFPGEMATVVAEDCTHMRGQLKGVLSRLRDPTQLKLFAPYKMAAIVDAPHFAEKESAPLLQLADAAAFGLRRFFAALKNGDALQMAIFAKNVTRDEGHRGGSGGITRRFRGYLTGHSAPGPFNLFAPNSIRARHDDGI